VEQEWNGKGGKCALRVEWSGGQRSRVKEWSRSGCEVEQGFWDVTVYPQVFRHCGSLDMSHMQRGPLGFLQ
jgi:hypothetical protein